MHGLAAMIVSLLFCILLLATHHALAQQQQSRSDTLSPSCLPHERDALLAFKHGVTSDPAGLLTSWRRDGGDAEQDCCRWRGVRCSNLTGHVHKLRLRGNYHYKEGSAMKGKISPSLIALEHLVHLDLSGNELEGPTGRLPDFLGSLKSLKYLNLSGIPFHGRVPPQLGNLSNLHYLDLSRMPNTNSTDISWLIRLPSIQYLNLGGVDLSTVVDWPHVMNMLPSLRVLRLSFCSLVSANQSLPHLNLTNLEELDASGNSFDHPMVTSWFWNITSLKYLYLQDNSLYGQFPDALEDMTSLQVLDLSNNYFDDDDDDDDKNMRSMTTNLKKLCNLEVLNLESTHLYGDVFELFRNLPRCTPNKLQELDLSFNQLSGMLPRWLGQLTSLVNLYLAENNITGSLPTSIGQFGGLKVLDLSHNNLNGNLPYEIGMLSNLTFLNLNSNKLDGTVTEEHFTNAWSLKYIDLSYNDLKMELSSDWNPPFRLHHASFAACQVGPLFPGWLQWHENITSLDVSSAGIAGRLPHWFSYAFPNVVFLDISNNQLNGTLPGDMLGFMSLENLDLSSNQLTGQIPTLPPTLENLYLSSNQLTGQIPTLPPNIRWLDISNNLLSGPLPSGIGSSNLELLSLFSNQITGHVHESFCKFQMLHTLDLSNNFLEGELPSCLSEMEHLEIIALSNNSLSGGFPSFLHNLTNVSILDLARNKFYGRLPLWTGKLMSLTFLQLSHNKFFGSIPVSITNLSCLYYMDLNNNNISGSLPRFLSSMKSMRKTKIVSRCSVSLENFFHTSSVSTFLKGQELDYGSFFRILETKMMIIDLSSNNLTGEIPEDIVFLDALLNLNLSRNHLNGVIPNKIGEMQSLESLDLSRNKLSGEIPASLPNLTFLSYLDLSYNNLMGRIPSGAQLDTLYAANPSMYIGNTGLCGHPLEKNCLSEGHIPKQGGLGRTEEDYEKQFFYLGLGCGFVVGTWMAFGVLFFKRSWRIACFQVPDKLYNKIYVVVATWARQAN